MNPIVVELVTQVAVGAIDALRLHAYCADRGIPFSRFLMDVPSTEEEAVALLRQTINRAQHIGVLGVQLLQNPRKKAEPCPVSEPSSPASPSVSSSASPSSEASPEASASATSSDP